MHPRKTRVKLPDYFITEKHDGMRILRRETVSQSEVLAIINQYERNKAKQGEKPLKEGDKASISLFPALVGGKKRNLCLKYYKFRGRLRALLDAFRPSRAVKSLKAAEAFLNLGIKTAKTFAVMERKKHFLLDEAFLIMEDISQNLGIPEYIEKNFSPPLTNRQILQKRTFILQFASYLSFLHQKGIYQTDFKTTNIFAREDTLGKTNFWMIDLDQVVFAKELSTRRKAKNLVQINTSIPAAMTLMDRMRFFLHYTGRKKLTPKDKRLIRRTLRWSWKRNPHWHPRFKMGARRIREWQ